jgi:hypothetical protein
MLITAYPASKDVLFLTNAPTKSPHFLTPEGSVSY